MARLNEPPVSTLALAPASTTTSASSGAAQPGNSESVDGVKRRFIKQNRELAKNNSSQSLRIRHLELQVSRLLAENLDLKGKVLLLEDDVNKARQWKVRREAVRRVQQSLRERIAELSGLVDEVEGHVCSDSDGDGVGRLERVPREMKVMEGARWRERQALTEVMRECQMPTIVEDKLYPRRTLDAQDILSIRLSGNSSNESPDLGPPPVAHFDDDANPLKQPVSPTFAGTAEKEAESDERLPTSLGVNLESRRKRKDGQARLEIRRHSILPSQSPSKADADASTMLRSGAKRKLADRDLEKPIKTLERGEFTFSRRGTGTDLTTSYGPSMPIEQAEGVKADTVATPPKPVRKVLGDRSVNMSPRKTSVTSAKPEKPSGPRTAAATAVRTQARSRRSSAIPQPLPPNGDVHRTIEIPPPEPEQQSTEPLPDTPAPLDFFSPTSSEPSATHPSTQSRPATPPPPTDSSFLGNTSILSTATDGGTRPSRRARAAVNYAEPSLVAKMRRPSKQMLDALTGLQDPRRAMSSTEERKSASRVSIKSESVESEDSWKILPVAGEDGEDVSMKVEVGDTVSSLDTPPLGGDGGERPSAASATISALMSSSRHHRSTASQPAPLASEREAAMIEKMDDLEIYDFQPLSSPAKSSPSSQLTKLQLAKARRHSSISRDLPIAEALDERKRGGSAGIDDNVGGDGGSVAGVGVGRGSRAASRRRSMIL